MSTPGMPSPVGRLVNTNTSERRRSSGTSEREPRSSTPWAAARGASVPASGPSPTIRARTARPSARRRRTTSTNRSGCFWGVRAPTKMSVASADPGGPDRGRNCRRVSSVRNHDHPLGGDPKRPVHSSSTSSPTATTRFGAGHDAPPDPLVERRRRSRVGPDDAVDQRAPGADECRHGVLHRVAAVGHHHCRIESGEHPPQPEGEAGFEALGGVTAPGMAERQVDLHLGRAVEEAEQPVADHSRFVEPVDQDACAELGTSAARRRDDVHDQRTAVVPEMRRHLRSLPLRPRRQRAHVAAESVAACSTAPFRYALPDLGRRG